MPSKWTFTIKPIRELLDRYVGDGKGWIDPFAGMNSPAEFTNDLNPEMPAAYHLLAEDFCKQIEGAFKGVLFDPPYSYRQISECYSGVGIKASQLDTSNRFYNSVKNAICDKIIIGGYVISFGWSSNDFGKNRGFKIVEILLIAHGEHHNDTIVTVEVKTHEQARL
uniref:Putative methyltransferase n=2 Tax=viral metagenome TaxID=1070528 RepID=A0A6M3JIR3_9ZZZZ